MQGIKEGRVLFENLKKVISYVLSANVVEIVPFLGCIAVTIPLAMEIVMV